MKNNLVTLADTREGICDHEYLILVSTRPMPISRKQTDNQIRIFWSAQPVEPHDQCDQIGVFCEFLGKIIRAKVTEIFANFWATLKISLLGKNCCGNFFAKFFNVLGYFSKIWSHCSRRSLITRGSLNAIAYIVS